MPELLRDVRRGDVLIVAKLDRLSRSLVDFAALMERAQRERWNIVALDLGVDLTSPHGEFLASVMAAISRWERRVIGQRTAEGLAAAKAKGVLPGRRSRLDQAIRERLLDLRGDGLSMTRIALALNEENAVTVSGRPWRASTVDGALRSIDLEQDAAQARESA
jgi:DNA invertase Pin-like site-specific DNA recombinase